MDLITTLIHGDRAMRPPGAVTPPIAQGVNWASESGEEFLAAMLEPMHPLMYNRHGNANHEQAGAIIAQLEGAERALVTAGGMAAVSTAVLTLVSAGDHVIGQKSMYGGVTDLLLNQLPRFGVETTVVDQGDLGAFEAAMRPNTKLILLETPSNPLLEITDLAGVADLARRQGALTLADNTFATPVNQRPIELGIDLVSHSATKYMGGHADLMAGVLVGSNELIERLWHMAQVIGAALSPFNAWLLLRGLRTLSLRIERHNANGMALARALDAHPAVSRVYYPGLPSHRNHEVASRQMSGFGGVLGFELEAGYDAADAFIEHVQLAQRASSVGHVSSLAAHPSAMWAQAMTPEQLEAAGIRPGLVRFSTGIEHKDDLVADVLAAVDRATS